MYNGNKIDEIRARIFQVRTMISDRMGNDVRRLAVTLLREIATELDCLNPVDANVGGFADDTDMVGRGVRANDIVTEDRDIPAAPGPDYATQKQLDTTRISPVNMIHASRDEFLALVGRVERIEMALAPRPDNDCRSGFAMSAAIDQGRRTELYNQAYLAALPRVVGQWGVDGAAGATGIIATQSMEYLK